MMGIRRTRWICFLVIVSIMFFAPGRFAWAETQKAIFPLRGNLFISQLGTGLSEYGNCGGYSHSQPTNRALDVIDGIDGNTLTGYAPFDIKVVYNDPDNYNTIVVQSVNPVLLRDGTVSHVLVLLAHDDNTYDIPEGKEISQGTAFYTEGTNSKGMSPGTVVTGSHIHIEFALGQWAQWINGSNASLTSYAGLTNSIDPSKYFWLYEGTTFAPAGNATMTAFNTQKWNNSWAPTYALQVVAGTGGSVDASVNGSYAQNAPVNLVATPNDNYSFSHWSSSNGGSFQNANAAQTTFTMPASSTTVTAHFKLRSITKWTSVTATAKRGPDATIAGRVQFANDRKAVEIGCLLGTDQSQVMAADLNNREGLLVAQSKAEAGLAFNEAQSYRFIDASLSAVNFGLQALKPDTKYYYKFYSVLDDGECYYSTYTDGNVGEFKTLGSTIRALTVVAGTGGTLTGSFSGQYVAGERITLSAQAATGYKFSHWNCDYIGAGPATFENITNAIACVFTMPDANTTITACFLKTAPAEGYNLEIVAEAGGEIRSGIPGRYAETATVSITAQAKRGYSFLMWESTAGTFNDPFNPSTIYAMTASNATVTARFVPTPTNLALSPAKVDYGKVEQLALATSVQSKTITITNNTSQAVTFIPKSGECFMFEQQKAVHLNAGESIDQFVVPYVTLLPGTYSETLRIETHEGQVVGRMDLRIEVTPTAAGPVSALLLSPFKGGDFQTWYIGWTPPAARTFTIRYVGSENAELGQPMLEKYANYFTVSSLSKTTLAPNETATFTVQPKRSIPLGYYSTNVQIKAKTNVAGTDTELMTGGIVSIHVKNTSVAASPSSLAFSSLPVGYAASAGQTVTLTNTGNTALELGAQLPTLNNYTITSISTAEWPSFGWTLDKGASFQFKILPKTGLPVGTHNELFTLPVKAENGVLVVSLPLSFTVTSNMEALELQISPSSVIRFGNAGIVNLTIGSNVAGFSIDNFKSFQMDNTYIEPGIDTYSLRTGSIIIQMNPIYLNTLSLGKHVITVGLQGKGYENATVTATITVVDEDISAPPKTGDNTPLMLLCALLLLSGAGLGAAQAHRRGKPKTENK